MSTVTVTGTFYGADEQPAENLAVTFRLSPNFLTEAGHYLSGMLTATTNSSGIVSIDLVVGARYVVQAAGQKAFAILIPDADASLESIHTTYAMPLTDEVQTAIQAAISAIDLGDYALAADLVAEIAARVAADLALDTAITDEAALRLAADQLLHGLIDSLSQGLDDETTARQQADTAETTARADADAVLTTAVNARITQAAADLLYAAILHTHTQFGQLSGSATGLSVYSGSGTGLLARSLSGQAGLFIADASVGFEAQTTADAAFVASRQGTSGALAVDLTRLQYNPSNTPVAGTGLRESKLMKTSTTFQQSAGADDTVWVDATHATRHAKRVISLINAALSSSLLTALEIDLADNASQTNLSVRHNGTLKRVVVDGSGFLKVS